MNLEIKVSNWSAIISTRFVDAFDEIGVDKKKIDWNHKLSKWIASAKGNEAIFTEVDLSGWNEVGERKELIR